MWSGYETRVRAGHLQCEQYCRIANYIGLLVRFVGSVFKVLEPLFLVLQLQAILCLHVLYLAGYIMSCIIPCRLYNVMYYTFLLLVHVHVLNVSVGGAASEVPLYGGAPSELCPGDQEAH